MKKILTMMVAVSVLACFARDMPISNGRLVTALNANQCNITNLPDAFWEGHEGGGGLNTNAVQSIIQRNIDTNLLLSASATNGFVTAAITNNLRGVTDMEVYAEEVRPEGPWTWTSENADLLAALKKNPPVPEFLEDQGPELTDCWTVSEDWTEDGWKRYWDVWSIIEGRKDDLVIVIQFEKNEYVAEATATRQSFINKKSDRIATTNDIKAAILTMTNIVYLKTETDAKFRTRTDNVCHETILDKWVRESTPIGISFTGQNTQPRYEEGEGRWHWIWISDQQITFYGSTDEGSKISTFADAENVYEFIAKRSTIATSNQTFVTYDNVPSTNGFVTASVATNAAEAVVSPVSNRVDYLDGYIAGQRVRVSVTNYYGNTSGELPRLRIEEWVTATNVVGGVATETNYWQIVWDEHDKYDTFKSSTLSGVSAMTNNLYQTYYDLLTKHLAQKAPRAWGTLTSSGAAAPAGSVWHTEPNTVFAGGTEYAHAMVGTGVIGVLTTKGAAVYTDGETGRFHFTTDDKQYFFGINIASRYELGCATDGITVTPVGGNQMVNLLYNVTMTGKPILYYTPTLSGNITWEQITDSSGSAIPGATVYASWDTQPPAGSEICTVNCGQGISGFFKAAVEYAATSKFETNMPADMQAGILATNVSLNIVQPIEPFVTNGVVQWRTKQ